MAEDLREVEEQCRQFRETFLRLRDEIGKVIVGHTDVVESVLICLLSGGHVLLEGVPGLGKTLLVRTLSSALTLTFRRIQFTPDLMPADIVGTNLVTEDPGTGRRQFQFQPGPIFHQCILADEINRATPKTQSAMLESMQERSVTVGGKTYDLPHPFIVLATQNPIEQEGTYPLPEAQLDRFMFKLLVPYSSREELHVIVDRTTAGQNPQARPILDGHGIVAAQQLVQRVVVAPHVKDYAIRLVLATHPQGEFAIESANRFVRFGGSPRGVQGIILAAKVRAMLDSRYHVSFDDVVQSYLPAMRHRIILNFEGQAEGVDNDNLLREILEKTPRSAEEAAKTS
jgi:MoxR-like ATPase